MHKRDQESVGFPVSSNRLESLVANHYSWHIPEERWDGMLVIVFFLFD